MMAGFDSVSDWANLLHLMTVYWQRFFYGANGGVLQCYLYLTIIFYSGCEINSKFYRFYKIV
jgi:hypothetical protein